MSTAEPTAVAERPVRREPTAEDFREVRAGAQFQELRSRYRSFNFPMSVAFFLWYVAYVVAATFFPELMALNVFGVLQFVTTFIITWVYVRYANKNIEPRAAAIRTKMEG